MSRVNRPWYLAPGNHDGFYTGNLHPPVGGEKDDTWWFNSKRYGSYGWNLRCKGGPDLKNEDRLDKPALLTR